MRELFEYLRRDIMAVVNYLTPTMILPFVVLVFLAAFFLQYKKTAQPLADTTEWIDWAINKPKLTFFTVRHRVEKSDIIPLAAITAVFTFLALFKLGDTTAPQTFFMFTEENRTITVELQNPEPISRIMFYTGLWTGHYTLEFSQDGNDWLEQMPVGELAEGETPVRAMDQPHSHLFKWRQASLNSDNPEVMFIRITSSRAPIELGELALYGADGALIPTSRISSGAAHVLFDEQELIPARPEYMNSMYFDEIYHGRTALEHLRNIRPYETTHPPLGKEIIAASIYTFGMTPFGWRFIGAMFGVAMLIVMYVLLKNMFGKTAVAACGTLLLGFDFMRFVQTRIATIDTYGVFFILLSVFFMYRYITTDADAPLRKSLLPLAMSGLAFGLGCASKWIVPYAGVGLAVVYAIRLVMLAKHYLDNSLPGYWKYLIKTLLFSVLFFAIVPIVIYCLSYIPYGLARDMTIGGGMLWDREYYKIIWDNQVSMFRYHSNLEAEHPFSSWWYQWITNARPILYYNSYRSNMRSSFAAFGNPVVWWGGFAAMVAIAIRAVKHRDGKALFIVIGYLSQLLPWVAVTRIVFIYHYFPSTLFLVMALAYVFCIMLERAKGWLRYSAYGYTALAAVMFGIFYPALTGVYAPDRYFSDILRWFPGAWPF